MQYIDRGLGVFHDSAFAEIVDSQPNDLAHLYRDLLARGALAGFEKTVRMFYNNAAAAQFSLGSAKSAGVSLRKCGRADSS
jgi:hypothetical protein